jgi:hypothetical protein
MRWSESFVPILNEDVDDVHVYFGVGDAVSYSRGFPIHWAETLTQNDATPIPAGTEVEFGPYALGPARPSLEIPAEVEALSITMDSEDASAQTVGFVRLGHKTNVGTFREWYRFRSPHSDTVPFPFGTHNFPAPIRIPAWSLQRIVTQPAASFGFFVRALSISGDVENMLCTLNFRGW